MPGGPLDEARLARAAAAGDGQAFARLYDAYEQRIYTFCFRLVGNEQDAQDATQDAFLKVLQRLPSLKERELNFGAYLFTAARNASYDVIGKRKKADAVEEIPEAGARPVYGDAAPLALDPERAAMLGSLQESVRGANERLPERQREVLALREVEELSYDEIAEIMDMNRNSVAQLISRARIKLRDELRGSALSSVAVSTADCERALPLISMRQDGQLRDDEDRAWLAAHIDGCDTCKVSVDAMEEAGISYRAWTPIVPAAFLFRDTMAKAAELTGSDWSAIGRPSAEEAPAQGPTSSSSGGPGAPGGGADASPAAEQPTTVLAGVGAAAGAVADVVEDDRRRRRGLFAALLTLVLVLGFGSVALVVGAGDPPQRTVTEEPAAAAATPAPTASPAATSEEDAGRPATTTRKKNAPTPRRTRPVEVVISPGVTQTVQVPIAPTAPTTPTSTRKPKKQRPSGSVDTAGGGGSAGGQSGGSRDPLQGAPTPAPTAQPTPPPAAEPTPAPTREPTPEPTPAPTREPDPTPTPCRPGATACPQTPSTCQPSGAGCSRGAPDPTPRRATTLPVR